MSTFQFPRCSVASLASLAVPSVEPSAPIVRVAGRLHSVRRHGRLTFADLWHGGSRVQVAIRALPPEPCPSEAWVIGAWLEVEGEFLPSRAGEPTIWAARSQLHQVPTRPLEELPSEGRAPPEQRWLLAPETLGQARMRSLLVRAVRSCLEGLEFEEVETPILTISPSGAAARPFETYARALERTLALRVAPEPHLIRLLAGGFVRIFEIAPTFRNEGISERHHPQFTLLEAYEAFADLPATMAQVEAVVRAALMATGVPLQAAPFRGAELNWTCVRRATLRALVREHAACASVSECQAFLRAGGAAVPEAPLEAWSAVFEAAVEPLLIQPTFVTEWPASISPLALSECGEWATRFELYAGGMELANGYEQNRSEALQRERFAAQARRAGREEIMATDAEYLHAMGWGLPPLSGFGIGIERLVMFATNASHIREAVLFPW